MANQHGGARAGAGRKKGSKDKLTKELKMTLTELAQQHTADAVKTLVEVMNNKQETGSARIAASNSILDRGWGKPIQGVVNVDPDKTDLPFDGWQIARVQPD